MSDEKRKMISVTSRLDRPITLHAHMKVEDDGAGRAFLGRERDNKFELQPGANMVDKEWFDDWRKQNPGFGMMDFITVEDEPESAERKE